jgi:hypothetical protein
MMRTGVIGLFPKKVSIVDKLPYQHGAFDSPYSLPNTGNYTNVAIMSHAGLGTRSSSLGAAVNDDEYGDELTLSDLDGTVTEEEILREESEAEARGELLSMGGGIYDSNDGVGDESELTYDEDIIG